MFDKTRTKWHFILLGQDLDQRVRSALENQVIGDGNYYNAGNISIGQETRRDKEKRKALSEWVAAVNSLGEYGEWCNDVSYNIADVEGIIAKYI